MKKGIILSTMLLCFGISNAQNNVDLTGKTFQQVNKIPDNKTELVFTSKTQVSYVITNIISGKTYIDKCNGTATLNGNKIAINCFCEDKEIYPDPIKDSFVYDPNGKKLTSTSFRSLDGVYHIWNQK